MIDINKSTNTNTFEVEILTPTHIGGAGENHWQNGIDFVAKDGKTWILDFNKLCKVVPVEKITLAFTRADRNTTIESLIRNVSIESISNKTFNFPNPGNDLKRHIFNGMNGKPYIPGSSIKGAIASVLVNHFIKKNNLRTNGDPSTTVLGSFENSIMRFFQFTDVPFEETILKNTKIFNLQNNGGNWIGGWKHSRETNQNFNNEFTTVYESLIPKDKSLMMLSFKNKAIEQLYLDAKREGSKTKTPPLHTEAWITNNPMAELCSIINKHTISFLEKEIKYYYKYKFDDKSESAYEELLNLKEKIKNLDSRTSCILRLAAGSGFHSITGDWQCDDYIQTGEHRDGRNAGKRKYKSRKLAFGKDVFQPMGFIKLTLLSQESIEAKKVEDEKNRLLKLAQIEEDKKLKVIEDARIEAERVAKEEAEDLAKIEAKKPKMFEGIIAKNKNYSGIDAEIIKAGKPNEVKIFVTNYENKKFQLKSYTNPLDIGTALQVNCFTKGDGSIYEVIFEKIK